MLTADQKRAIVADVEAGIGRFSACRRLGVPLASLREALVADVRFREEVQLCEAALVDQCMLQVFSAALESPSAAAEYIKLARSRSMEKVKVKLARKQLAIQSRAVDSAIAGSGGTRLDFRALTDDEFRRYSAIHVRLRDGNPVDAADAVEYARLTAKISSSAPPAIPTGGNGFHAKSIEEMFDDEDD